MYVLTNSQILLAIRLLEISIVSKWTEFKAVSRIFFRGGGNQVEFERCRREYRGAILANEVNAF